LLGVAHQVFDQSGALRVLSMDFKGNATAIERILARDYKNIPDWSGPQLRPPIQPSRPQRPWR